MKSTYSLILLLAFVSLSCAKDLSTDRDLVYARPNRVPLKFTLYEPEEQGEALRPAIVAIHGGAWRMGDRYQQRWYCNHFAHAGYVVMTIEYRLMPDCVFPDCLHDCKAAVRWLRTHAREYRVDPERIATFGASAGGHLAAFLAVTTPEDGLEGTENPGPTSRVGAAVVLYGAVDLTKYRDPPERRFGEGFARKFVGRFVGEHQATDGADPFAVASPITYIRPDTCPMLLAHGTKDMAVHYAQSADFYAKLEENGVPARLLTYPNRNHGFDYFHHKERQSMFAEMVRFLNEHLVSVQEPPQG